MWFQLMKQIHLEPNQSFHAPKDPGYLFLPAKIDDRKKEVIAAVRQSKIKQTANWYYQPLEKDRF